MNKEFENAFIFDHPLIQHKLSLLRDKETSSKSFRALVEEISMLMAYEATRDFALEEVEIETPLCKTKTMVLSSAMRISLVPILRAGLGMVDGMLNIIPQANIGHIGLYRDPETAKPVEYYCKLPGDIAQNQVILLDPMFATGGTAIASVDILKKHGCTNIRWMSILAAPEGIKNFHAVHPEIPVFCAGVDECLNDHAYIVPGLGDCGDRLFGTK